MEIEITVDDLHRIDLGTETITIRQKAMSNTHQYHSNRKISFRDLRVSRKVFGRSEGIAVIKKTIFHLRFEIPPIPEPKKYSSTLNTVFAVRILKEKDIPVITIQAKHDSLYIFPLADLIKNGSSVVTIGDVSIYTPMERADVQENKVLAFLHSHVKRTTGELYDPTKHIHIVDFTPTLVERIFKYKGCSL